MFLASDISPVLIPIILVAVFGVIVLIVILLKRHVSIFKSDEKPPSSREVAEEELNRILRPIEEDVPVKDEEEESKPEEESEGKPEEPEAKPEEDESKPE